MTVELGKCLGPTTSLQCISARAKPVFAHDQYRFPQLHRTPFLVLPANVRLYRHRIGNHRCQQGACALCSRDESGPQKVYTCKQESCPSSQTEAAKDLIGSIEGSFKRILQVLGLACLISLAWTSSAPEQYFANAATIRSCRLCFSAFTSNGQREDFRGLHAPTQNPVTETGATALPFLPNGFLGSNSHTPEEDAAATEEGKELIREVWEVIALKYADVRGGGFDQAKWAQLRDEALRKPLRDQGAAYRAIRTMLADGVTDRFTRFVPKELFASMNSYDITGVGLNLSTASELEDKTDLSAKQPGLYVLGLINQSAAKKAGISQGDQILEVDGVAITDQTPFDAAAMIQVSADGSNKPTVAIKVRKANSDRIAEYNLQRTVVGVESSPVTARMVTLGNRKIGSIKLDKFVARSQPDVASAVRRLSDDGAEEFVLDLRNNLGGLVEEGVEVARLFLDGGATIVNRLDNGGLQRRTASGTRALTHAPLTLLVNERTASASEIFAGALKDNCRAVLVGSRTYGKGLIQSVYQLEDGSALVVTIGKYLTPARIDIDREGLRPDFGSIPDRETADAQIAACKTRLAA